MPPLERTCNRLARVDRTRWQSPAQTRATGARFGAPAQVERQPAHGAEGDPSGGCSLRRGVAGLDGVGLHGKLVFPGPWAVVRHALPTFVVGKVIPIVLFLGFFRLTGTAVALIVALGWSLAVIAHRLATRQRVPGLVLVSTLGLIAKTIVALATGSLAVYFLQPTVGTALVGIAFAVSVARGQPLAERLAHDFCPFEPDTANHPLLSLFFDRLSRLWAVTSLVNAGVTLWLVLTQSVTTFVLIKSFLGPSFTAATLAIAAVWFRFRLRRHGLRLEFSSNLTPITA